MIDDPYESPFFTEGNSASKTSLARVLRYARETGSIEPRWCWQPIDVYLSAREAARVRSIRKLIRAGMRGMAYTPPHDPPNQLSVSERMALIAGTCIRNSIDARVRVVEDLLDQDVSPATRDAQVLLIPDFCAGPTEYTPSAVRKLRGLILDRGSRERYTVVFMSRLEDVEAAFGKVLRDHITARWQGDPR